MTDDPRTGRMNVRFSDDDKAWLAEQAEDEGVEPATLVRLIVNRLRRGRPLLMSHVVAAPMRGPAYLVPEDRDMRPGHMVETDSAEVAEDVLAQRLAELDNNTDVVPLRTEEESAAIPLRRVPRNSYNPGRN